MLAMPKVIQNKYTYSERKLYDCVKQYKKPIDINKEYKFIFQVCKNLGVSITFTIKFILTMQRAAVYIGIAAPVYIGIYNTQYIHYNYIKEPPPQFYPLVHFLSIPSPKDICLILRRLQFEHNWIPNLVSLVTLRVYYMCIYVWTICRGKRLCLVSTYVCIYIHSALVSNSTTFIVSVVCLRLT